MDLNDIAVVVPVKNEEKTIQTLIDSVDAQTFLPKVVVFVDGGSKDKTNEIIEKNVKNNSFKIKLIKTKDAYPGEARNIGIKSTVCKLIAFTDAGIRLNRLWLEELIRPLRKDEGVDVVYGAYEPVIDSFIRDCSLIAFIPPKETRQGLIIRTDFIASSLFKREICDSVGGFPPFRAAEDRIFMDKVKNKGAKVKYTDRAIAYWEIPGSIKAIFKRSFEFSYHDLIAKRGKDWHYSVFRTYGILLIFLALGIFIQPLFLFGILAVWGVRLTRLFIKKKKDFKLKFLVNLKYFSMINLIVFLTDTALFCGAVKYTFSRHGKTK